MLSAPLDLTMPPDKTMISVTPETLNAIAREVRSLKGTDNYHLPNRRGAEMFSATAGNSFDGRLAYEVEQFASAVSNPARAIGRMPPEPPSLRARVGAVLVRLVRRCLFWYTEQINEMYAKTGDLFRRISVQLSNLDRERDRQRQLIQDLTAEVDRLNKAMKSIREDVAESGNSLAIARQDLDAARRGLAADLQSVLTAALEKERAALRKEFEAALQEYRIVLRKEAESIKAEMRESLRKAE
jgi:outer membrane murein-binding lipoprotein Lpp